MRIKKEDTLFVGNDCLYGKSNRHFRQIIRIIILKFSNFPGEKMISLEKPIVFLYTNNDKEKVELKKIKYVILN